LQDDPRRADLGETERLPRWSRQFGTMQFRTCRSGRPAAASLKHDGREPVQMCETVYGPWSGAVPGGYRLRRKRS